MKLEGRPAFGVIENDQIELVDAPPYEAYKRSGKKIPLKGAKLLPPVIPYNFYAAGINFLPHIEWANQYLGMSIKPPTQADIGYRSANALVGHNADIVVPKDSKGPIHFEGELVAIVGKKTKRISEKDALSCIAGYTLGNDMSERTSRRPTARCGAARTSTPSSRWALGGRPARPGEAGDRGQGERQGRPRPTTPAARSSASRTTSRT